MFRYGKWLLVLTAGLVLGWFGNQYWPGFREIGSIADKDSQFPVEQGYWKNGEPPGKSSPSSQKITISMLLDIHQYELAIQIFQGHETDESRKHARADIVSHLEVLLKEGDYPHLGRLLTLYLYQEYRDIDALLIQAELYRLQKDYIKAIDTLYSARSYEYRQPQIAYIDAQIRKVVAEYDTQLQAADDYHQLAVLYENLVYLARDNPQNVIKPAKAQLALNRHGEVWQTLNLVAADPRVSDEVNRLIAEMDNAVTYSDSAPAVIPLIRQGNHFIVEAQINNAGPIRLMLDTGASMTVVRSDILHAAGVAMAGNAPLRRFTTANGETEGPVYRVDSLSLGDQRVKNIDIAVLDLSGLSGADGLLGMDYLKHFKIYIDQAGQELRLSKPR